MSECMTFPDTVEEFMEQYKIVDSDHVYTNGTEFVPVFRMRQWFDHLQAKPLTNADRIRAMTDEELAQFLCETHVFEGACSGCIANEYCKPGHNGMFEWLREEVKE